MKTKTVVGILFSLNAVLLTLIYVKTNDLSALTNKVSSVTPHGEDYFNPLDYKDSSSMQMVLTDEAIKKISTDIIKGGRIFWDEEGLLVYDIKNKPPYYFQVNDSEKQLKYKIENKTLYISEYGKNWEKVKVKIINANPPKLKKDEEPVVLIIYLECKWFKGEYELLGIPG